MHPRWILWVYSAVGNSVSDTERGFFCGYCLLQEAKMLRWVSEWVSVTTDFWSWSKFDPVFLSAIYCLFTSTLVVRHSHLIHNWVLPFCDFWLIATKALFSVLAVTLRKTAQDNEHLTIISGLWRLKIKVSLAEISL